MELMAILLMCAVTAIVLYNVITRPLTGRSREPDEELDRAAPNRRRPY
jgi:TRAP-type C4-dicarboxylate transport system permease small subunit